MRPQKTKAKIGDFTKDVVDYAIMAEVYKGREGCQAEADLGLGCGMSTDFALFKPGDVVADLVPELGTIASWLGYNFTIIKTHIK